MPDAPFAILLIEADPVTRELYQRELDRHFRVLTGRDEAEALQLLETANIQAVVLEPAMANGAGWRLLENLRDQQLASPPRIVLCSVLDERRRGMNLGAAAYLVKPVLPATLIKTLHQVLQG